MSTTDYLSLDQVEAYTFHGVKVCTLGEDGDMGEIAFTHDRRRAIAAAAALYRTEYGVRATAIHVVNGPQWWRFIDHCGCGNECACPQEGDPEHLCTFFGLPPCVRDGLAWIGFPCAADAPGALAVIQLDVTDAPPTIPMWTAHVARSDTNGPHDELAGPDPLVRHWPDTAPAAAEPSRTGQIHV